MRELSDWKSDPSIPEAFVDRAFLIIKVENSDMSDDNWECRARSVFQGQIRSHQNLEELITMCSKKAGMFVRPSLLPGVPWLLVWRNSGATYRHAYQSYLKVRCDGSVETLTLIGLPREWWLASGVNADEQPKFG